MLKNDEAFLDIYRYHFWENARYVEDRYAVIVIGATSGPTLIDLGSSTAVDKAAREWRSEVIDASEAMKQWQSLRLGLEATCRGFTQRTRKLWVSPDGELARIPWQLMPQTDPDTKDMLFLRQTPLGSWSSFTAGLNRPLPPASQYCSGRRDRLR